MPPKRKQRDEIASDSGSEPDKVSLRRPTAATLLPEVLQNIDMLKAKRDRGRKDITAELNTYVTRMKKRIGDRFVEEAKQRSAEAKALLNRYIDALERRAAIEKSIEDIVLNTHEDLKGLSIVFEAAYSGRQQQSKAAVGSFAPIDPIDPVPAKELTSAPTADSPDATGKGVSDMRDPVQSNKDGKDERAGDNNSTHDKEDGHQIGERPEDIFGQISW
ncbi:hypothetical protein SAMD00023353_0202820 [Rosellinia necatrix]|uniref:Uncharacterized protein n=1 Tax=Rosellinia necatrix TaxID=77044 RepID=A0A1S7UJD2_ROSNE|nr:hypothetical protein SAMD00023353_0202820 [Rosellinia necatrix]